MTERLVTVAVYIVLGVGLLATEISARRPGSRVRTFPRLIHEVMEHRAAQLGLLLAWWWVGWHFLVDH